MSRNEEQRRFRRADSGPGARRSRAARGGRLCWTGDLAYFMVGLAAMVLGWSLHPLLSRALPSIDFGGQGALALFSAAAFALGLGAAAVWSALIRRLLRRCSLPTRPRWFRR